LRFVVEKAVLSFVFLAQGGRGSERENDAHSLAQFHDLSRDTIPPGTRCARLFFRTIWATKAK
jgi:hypothetical protein